MKCPKCDMMARIVNNKTVVEDGNAYSERTIKCLNKKCTLYDTILTTLKDKLD